MSTDVILETARLVLRPPRSQDLDWFLANLNSAAVMRHLGGPRPADAVAASLAHGIAGFARDKLGFWTVICKANGELVGKCGLSLIRNPHAPAALHGLPDAGWSLAEGWWGKGWRRKPRGPCCAMVLKPGAIQPSTHRPAIPTRHQRA